jgi:hypothetical protein
MAAESYEYYLRLLSLPRTASEADIRSGITNELRLWTRRTNAPTLEGRQEAERRILTLEMAEKVLLGAEGRIIRSQLGSQSSGPAQPEVFVDADTVARTIESLASVRGTKSQERKGAVLYRRAAIFYRGVDYLCEELLHKKYDSAHDRKHCQAAQGGLVLFDWACETTGNPGRAMTKTYIQGSWVADLVSFAADCGIE